MREFHADGIPQDRADEVIRSFMVTLLLPSQQAQGKRAPSAGGGLVGGGEGGGAPVVPVTTESCYEHADLQTPERTTNSPTLTHTHRLTHPHTHPHTQDHSHTHSHTQQVCWWSRCVVPASISVGLQQLNICSCEEGQNTFLLLLIFEKRPFFSAGDFKPFQSLPGPSIPPR